MKEPVGPDAVGTGLGIAHLLAWTACTAVYLAIRRSLIILPPGVPFGAQGIAVWSLQGIGAGAALGGLLLTVARRRRGVRFPVYPGEVLLLLSGVGVAVDVLLSALSVLTHRPQEGGLGLPLVLWVLILLARNLALAFAYLVAARKVRVRRWRLLFLALAASWTLAEFESCCLTIPGRAILSSWISYVPFLLPKVILAVIAVGDLRRRRRYPWTHWAGVGTGLWFGAAAVVNLVWWTLV